MKIPSCNPLIFVALASFSFSPLRAQNVQSDFAKRQLERTKVERAQFLEVELFSRLPRAEQEKKLPQLYRLFSQIKERTFFAFSSVIFLRMPFPENADQWPPEKMADAIQNFFGGQFFTVEAKARAANVLRAHKEAVKPLILHDLKSRNADEIKRGFAALDVISNIDTFENLNPQPDPTLPRYMKGFYKSVRTIFRRNGDFKNAAARAFVHIGDTRAVDELVEANPKNSALYHDELSSFSSRVRPHPKLLRLLDSPDAKLRAQAMDALSWADPNIMFPYVERLLQDSDADVRWSAFAPAAYSNSPRYAVLNRVLIAMLNDPDESLRWVSARHFAQKKDSISLRPLLKLLQSETLKISPRDATVQTVRDFTGTDFGYVIDNSVEQQKLTPENIEALSKFEKWINENYPNA